MFSFRICNYARANYVNSAFLLAFVITASYIVTQGGAQDLDHGCNPDLINSCSRVWFTRYTDAKIFLPDEKFLDNNCLSLMSFVECVGVFSRSCANDEFRMSAISSSMLLLYTVRQLCDKNSTLRAEYLEYVPCINSHKAKIIGTVSDTFEEFMAFRNYYVGDYDTDFSKQIGFACLLTQVGVKRTVAVIEENCGDNAGNSATGIIARLLAGATEFCSINGTEVQQTEEAYEWFNQMQNQFSGISPNDTTEQQNTPDNALAILEETCPNEWAEAFRLSDLIVPDSEFLNKHCADILTYVDCADIFYSSAHKYVRHGLARNHILTIAKGLRQLCHKERNTLQEYTSIEGCINRLRNDIVIVLRLSSGDPAHIDPYQGFHNSDYGRTASRGLSCVLVNASFSILCKNMRDQCGENVTVFGNGFIPKFLTYTTKKCQGWNDSWLKVIGTDIVRHSRRTHWKCRFDSMIPHQLEWIRSYFRGHIIPLNSTLDNICSDLKQDFRRLMAYADACNPDTEMRYPKRKLPLRWAMSPIVPLDKLIELLKRLCDNDTKLRSDYGKYASCANNHERAIGHLIKTAAVDVDEFMTYRSKEVGYRWDKEIDKIGYELTPNATRALNCMARGIYQPQFLGIIKDKCGDESRDYFHRLLNLIFYPIEEYCPGDKQLQDISEQYIKYKLYKFKTGFDGRYISSYRFYIYTLMDILRFRSTLYKQRT